MCSWNEALQALDHPHIVEAAGRGRGVTTSVSACASEVIEYFDDVANFFLVMELCTGTVVPRQWCREGAQRRDALLEVPTFLLTCWNAWTRRSAGVEHCTCKGLKNYQYYGAILIVGL